MNRKIIIRLLCLVWCIVGGFLHASNTDHLPLSFVGSPYPKTPTHILRSRAMQAWGDAHAAARSYEFKCTFENNLDRYVELMLQMYADVDAMHKEHAQKAETTSFDLQEIQSILTLVASIEQQFDRAMSGHRSDQASCIKIVLQKIQKKLEQTLA